MMMVLVGVISFVLIFVVENLISKGYFEKMAAK